MGKMDFTKYEQMESFRQIRFITTFPITAHTYLHQDHPALDNKAWYIVSPVGKGPFNWHGLTNPIMDK